MSSTRQDFINWVQANEQQAYGSLGSDKWNQWANNPITSRLHEEEYNLWLQSGDTNELRNMIRFSAGLSTIETGKMDFSGAKKRLGDQYRQYLAIAQNVLNMSRSELTDLENQLVHTIDPNAKDFLQYEIQVQKNTITAQQANVTTWQETLDNAISNGLAR